MRCYGKKVSFIDRLELAYVNGKKPLAYIIILTIFSLEVLSELSIIDAERAIHIERGLIVTLWIMMLEILFQVYEKVVARKTSPNKIGLNALYDETLPLIKNSKHVDIQYIGAAGRHGWNPVLAKLLDKSAASSLHDVDSFNIEVAFIAPEFYESNKLQLTKIDVLYPIVNEIRRVG